MFMIDMPEFSSIRDFDAKRGALSVNYNIIKVRKFASISPILSKFIDFKNFYLIIGRLTLVRWLKL